MAMPLLFDDVSAAELRRTATVSEFRFDRRTTQFGKRSFDVVVASLLLVFLVPVLLLVALAIKLGDRGPVLYRQRRVGFGGRTFEVLKFRSMRPGADRMLL